MLSFVNMNFWLTDKRVVLFIAVLAGQWPAVTVMVSSHPTIANSPWWSDFKCFLTGGWSVFPNWWWFDAWSVNVWTLS
jgi:hypothetical protein